MKDHAQEWSRREFLRIGAAAGAGAGASLAGSPANAQSQSDRRDDHAPDEFNEATIAQLQAAMARGKLSSVELTRFYLNRIQAIDERGPHLNSVIQVNPDALDLAREADDRRRRGHVRGPLDGIPVLLKDNIDTGDKQQTTAGSFALVGQPAPHDATVAAKLRAGGAVILGKANLSEWANFRSFDSSSGWSAVGGQCNNPYAIDRNPCGSSSGSGAAVSANLCTVALATETDGSIVCPAHNNGVVGIKPTVGVTSRAGVVPISHRRPHDHSRHEGDTVFAGRRGKPPIFLPRRAPQRLAIECGLHSAIGKNTAGTGDASRTHRRRAPASERQSESAHRQLVRVHAQSQDAEWPHRHRLRSRRRRGHGNSKLPGG